MLAGVPHVAHASVPELAEACDLVVLVLTDDQDIWAILDQQGLLKALKPGSMVVNHGTGDPTELRNRGLSGADGLAEVVNLLSTAGVKAP